MYFVYFKYKLFQDFKYCMYGHFELNSTVHKWMHSFNSAETAECFNNGNKKQ